MIRTDQTRVSRDIFKVSQKTEEKKKGPDWDDWKIQTMIYESLACQEIIPPPRFLWNPNIYNRVHKNPMLSQLNPLLTLFLFYIHLNIIFLPPMLRYLRCCLPLTN
jgi:hypothetical protein